MPVSAAQGTRATVVVIDDSPGDRHWFKLTALETGVAWNIMAYPTIAAAKAALAQTTEPCSVVFMNAVLAALTLEEACVEIRSTPATATAPIVVMVDGEHEVAMARRLGLPRCIWKPIDPVTLKRTIDEIVSPGLSSKTDEPVPVVELDDKLRQRREAEKAGDLDAFFAAKV